MASTSDYRLTALTIDKVAEGKVNAGKIFVSGQLRNTKCRWEEPYTLTIFEEDDPIFVEVVRHAFPKGNPWHGTNEEIPVEGFDRKVAEKSLQNVDGEDYTLFHNGKYLTIDLGGKYVRKYNNDVGGHHTGEWVCEPNSNFIKVETTATVFVLIKGEERFDPQTGKDISDYMKGFFPEDGRKKVLRNLIPVENLSPAERALINPKWGLDIAPRSITPPSNDNQTADTATSGGTDDTDF